jgi:thiol-disulfide isomerase/thioredoxin
MTGKSPGAKVRAALCGGIIGLGYMVTASPGSADDTRPPMPALLLADGSGMNFPLSRYSGTVLVLEFWNSSCGPCLKELGALNRLQGDFPGLPLLVLAVSEDNGGMAALRSLMGRQKLGYLRPFADPGGSAAQALALRGLPTSFVIDRHGRLAMHFEGPQPWDRADIEQRLKFLMLEP